MTVFFTADTHFGHKRMATTWRNYDSVADMDEAMLTEWNETIRPHDTVWHLGDFSFYNKADSKAIFDQLHGKKSFVRGNHDDNRICRLGWEEVHMLVKRRVDGQSLWLCHYPLMTWANAHHGTWHLHGHSHGNLPAERSTRTDVGIDSTGKIAVTYDEIHALLSAREYDFVDHHTSK